MASTTVNNTIFNNAHKITQITNPHTTSLDYNSMNNDEERIFNTYRYWEPFYIPMQNVVKDGKSMENGEPAVQNVTASGVKALFSNYNAVFTDDTFRVDANMPLLDNPDSRKRQRENMACTIKDLVDASVNGLMGRQVYNYSDFAYCKHLGKLSNNYLITLRRFGAPCGDRIDIRAYPRVRKYDNEMQAHMPDIGRMVTWMGTPGNEMSNILKYNYGVNWEEQTAEIKEEQSDGEGAGPLASLFNMSNSNYRKQVQRGFAGKNFMGRDFMTGMLGGNASFDPPYSASTFSSMYDSTKVYGPIDVIDKTKKRKRGLNFEHKFTLTFDYELRSYYGVNGKAAMADLLGNILATTYTHGTFWGGERRWVGAAQDNIFANLPIFKLADAGGLNNPSAVMDAFIASIDQGAKAISSNFRGSSTKEKIINVMKDIGGMMLGGVLNKLGRPQKHAMASLISGAPVGCWHLTIGNPKSPIIEIGNLICTNTEIEHYGPLGLDDFPTGLRVKVTLEHGKPRDIMGIEQMYGRGDTRIYSPMGDKVLDMYTGAKSISKVKLQRSSDYTTDEERTQQENTVKEMQQNSTTLDTMNQPAVEEHAEMIPAEPDDSLTSLMRYFGMTDKGLIKSAGAEALFGAERHKNDHVKKPAAKKP